MIDYNLEQPVQNLYTVFITILGGAGEFLKGVFIFPFLSTFIYKYTDFSGSWLILSYELT